MYESEELMGQNYSILKHPDTSKDFMDNLLNTLNTGNKWQVKMRNLAKDGSTFYSKTTNLPIFDENSNLIKFLSNRRRKTKFEKINSSTKR